MRWSRLLRRRRDRAPEAGPPRSAVELLRQVRGVELRARRGVDELLLGAYRSAFRGHGIEFHELRPYVPGDDARAIDWKTFARRGEPYVRRYREDRELSLILAVDVSASLRTGISPRTKEEVAAEICAVLALAAIRNNDKVGLLLFTDVPERYVRPRGGSRHVLRVVRELLDTRPAGRGTDVGRALAYLRGGHRRRATVFLISDFLADLAPNELRAAARRHELIAVRIRDPLDEELPNLRLVRVRDSESGEEFEVDAADPKARAAYRSAVRAIDERRRALFGELGIDEIAVRTDVDFVPELLRYFRRRLREVGAA